MLSGNREIFDQFKRFRMEDINLSENTHKGQFPVIKKLGEHLDKPFKEANKQDIIEFLNRYKLGNSRDIAFSVIRIFYKWLFDYEEGDKLPECIRGIKFSSSKLRNRLEDIDYKDKVISEEDYQKLLNACTNLRDKAILETLWYFGVRKGELVSINANDIEDHGKYIQITIRESKTKKRRPPTTEFPQFLLEFYQTHPFKDQKNKPFFYSRNRNKKHDMKRLNGKSVNKLLNTLCKYANIKRKICPHDFRHTAISRDRLNKMPVTLIEEKYGLTKGSKQIAVYDHNGSNELIDYLTKTNPNLERPETTEKIKRERDELLKVKKELKGFKEKIKSLTETNESLNSRMQELQSMIPILAELIDDVKNTAKDVKPWYMYEYTKDILCTDLRILAHKGKTDTPEYKNKYEQYKKVHEKFLKEQIEELQPTPLKDPKEIEWKTYKNGFPFPEPS